MYLIVAFLSFAAAQPISYSKSIVSFLKELMYDASVLSVLSDWFF